MKTPVLILGLIAAQSAAYSQQVVSTFDSNADGWTLYDDGPQQIEWQPTSGNPGGCVRFVDNSQGGVGRFSAPTKFIGDKSAYYGGTLSFDTFRETSGEAGIDPIVLSGGTTTNFTLSFSPTNIPPYATWANYTIPLVASAGWKFSFALRSLMLVQLPLPAAR